MIAWFEQAHVGVGAWNIENRLVARFLQCERVRGVGDHLARERDAHAFAISRDGDGMIGAGKFHGVCLVWLMDNCF